MQGETEKYSTNRGFNTEYETGQVNQTRVYVWTEQESENTQNKK